MKQGYPVEQWMKKLFDGGASEAGASSSEASSSGTGVIRIETE
jgi:hypothetical protein